MWTIKEDGEKISPISIGIEHLVYMPNMDIKLTLLNEVGGVSKSKRKSERKRKADIWTNFMSLYHCCVLFYLLLFSNEWYFTGIGIFYYLLPLYLEIGVERIIMRRLCIFSSFFLVEEATCRYNGSCCWTHAFCTFKLCAIKIWSSTMKVAEIDWRRYIKPNTAFWLF